MIIRILFCILLFTIDFYSLYGQTQNYYTLPHGQTITIDEWNTCKSVTNNIGASIFIPTKTSDEWNSFIINYPNGITLYTCGFTCGDVLVDSRDGQSYNTVQIGTQCWMAQNLNYGEIVISAQSQMNNLIPEKYCFNDDPGNCDISGGLYQWDEIMNYTTPPDEDLCPTGWYLPTESDWKIIELYMGMCSGTGLDCYDEPCCHYRGVSPGVGTKLKLGGSSGFEALTLGYWSSNDYWYGTGNVGLFWTGTQTSSTHAYYRAMKGIGTGSEGIMKASTRKNGGFSVRCIKLTQ